MPLSQAETPLLPVRMEKDPGRASVSVMPLSTYLKLGLGELAHTKLTVELADRTVKYPKGIAENVLVGIGKFVFPITLRIEEERIIFKSVKPASSLIKRVYMLSLKERMELDLEARLIGETLVINRSLDPLNGDYIELNDLNKPFELRRNQGDDLMHTIEEGEVIEEFRTRDDEIDTRIDDYRSYCDYDKKIHIDYYALWDVIENGNSFKPTAQTTTNADGTSTTLIPSHVTTEDKVQKKNDVKTRSMLLIALHNEHLMTFNQYKDAKTLFAAIQTRFGSNEATKKTHKTLLKQMYENFSALSTKSLDSIFNRLQKIVSQLAILGENISQEDLNLKFLRSLPSEWNTHIMVWRNKPDLDTMRFDDLYNNFKIVEQEVKRTASSSSSLSSHNMAFVSSPSSTNEVNTAYGVSTANT
ncbi:hypothetical protein Tco_1115283 [Tanacetum coccineum]